MFGMNQGQLNSIQIMNFLNQNQMMKAMVYNLIQNPMMLNMMTNILNSLTYNPMIMNDIKNILKEANKNISTKNLSAMIICLKEICIKQKYSKYKEEIKEIIQLMTDYLIYSDKKNDQVIFECFCELNFMQELIHLSKCNIQDILVQIIKSLSALILTLTNPSYIFYLFSQNFINQLITNDSFLNFNEDFYSFYVNFLKSLSLKIDKTTIKLFFNKEKNSFPLLENALRIYNFEDSMIKNVIRNIFLTFVKMDYEPLQN